MYQIGDVVVYGNNGVYEIVDIGSLDFVADRNKQYYTMKSVFDEKDERIYCPVETKGYIRKVKSEAEMTTQLDEIHALHTESVKPLKNADLIKYYKDVLETHDQTKYLETSIGILKKQAGNGRILGQIDDQYLKKMMNMICQEIAYVYHTSPDAAKNRLIQELSAQAAC